METTIAYLSRGRLFLQTGTGAPREISSPYVESVRRSVVEIEQRRAWKTKGMGARFMRGFDFGGGSPNGNEIAFSITDITPGPAPGTLIYSLFVDDVSGLYLWDGKDERRLIHSNKFVIRDIDARGDKVLCTLEYGATANLALFDIEPFRSTRSPREIPTTRTRLGSTKTLSIISPPALPATPPVIPSAAAPRTSSG